MRMARTRPKTTNSFYTQLDGGGGVDGEHTVPAVRVDAYLDLDKRMEYNRLSEPVSWDGGGLC